MKQFYVYCAFLHKLLFKKVNSIVIPLFVFSVSLIAGIVIWNQNIKNIKNINSTTIIYAFLFLELLFTTLYASIKALNLFKEQESDALDILVFSKPISRKKMFISKQVTFISFGLMWSLVVFTSNISAFFIMNLENALVVSFISFASLFFSYLIFGNIAALIAYKLSSKLALTISLVISTPLVIGGVVINSNSTSTANNFAYYLNTPYQFNRSNTAVNTNQFYLNNNKDNYYILANGYKSDKFSDLQKEFINNAYGYAENSSKSWQVYSWLSLPYQLIDAANVNNKNPLSFTENNSENNLKDYIFYNHLDSIAYNYNLVKDPKIATSGVNDDKSKYYIVPGLLKVDSKIDNLINTKIVYARENASTFDVTFPEDNFIYSSPNNLVGEISWQYTSELLNSDVFKNYARSFYANLFNKLKQVNSTDLFTNKKLLLDEVSSKLNEISSDSSEAKLVDPSTTVLDENAIKNNKIKNLTEKKVYLAVGLLYYLYFAHNDSFLTKALLSNEDPLEKDNPSKIVLEIDGYKYEIGGYSSFTAKQEVKNDKVVIRYELEPSDNYLFQKVNELYSLERGNQIVDKNYYYLIWVVIAMMVVFLNTYLYMKKDYK